MNCLMESWNMPNPVPQALPDKTEKLKNNVYEMQLQKFELFKAQDPKTGYFDATFEIEGKYLYAHKFVLAAVSETFNAWLSDRWTTASNDPIKIETYSFHVFYQLCCFLYSGGCSLTKENIFQLIDAAEFFGLQLLKNDCEEFLLPLKVVDENNIYEMAELAEKYSLQQLSKNINFELSKNLYKLVSNANFVKLEKSKVLRLCKCFNNFRFSSAPILDSLYKWSNYQAENKQDKNFNESVKNVFNEFLPHLNFNNISAKYLKTFLAKYPFLFSVADLHKFFHSKSQFHSNPQEETEAVFEMACQMSENQLKKSSEISANDVFKDLIKKELSDFVNKIQLSDLSYDFVINFIVQRKCLFSTATFLKILAECNKYDDQEEKIFKIMYHTAEKEVLRKQAISPVETFNLAKAINVELAEFLPNIRFYLMDSKYVMESLVKKGIISFEHTFYNGNTKVQIKCGDKTIFGIFHDKFGIVNEIKKNRPVIHSIKELEHSFDHLKCTRPEAQSEIEISDGIEWYLCLTENGILAAKHYTLLKENDYLIAEMQYGRYKKGFQFEKNRFTDICAYRV